MKRILKTLIILSALAFAYPASAQIKNLSELKPNKPYLLRCVYDYGYCIYKPGIDENNATLGEALTDHPDGNYDDMYREPINVNDKNNQWYIISDNQGYYYLKNVGKDAYISGEQESNWGGWWGSSYTYSNWYFTDEAKEISIESNGDGVWLFRPKSAEQNYNDYSFLCAAGHSATAMLSWTSSDAGSNWEILSIEDDIKLYHKSQEGEDVGPSIEERGELGEVIPKGDTRYFCFLDSQIVAIPEEFILDRQEDDQFITLTLFGDSTITMSKYAIDYETTEAPSGLPVIESFKFNNKFNDGLYTDAIGDIDNEKDSILIRVPSIGKNLIASIKLPSEEDELGTKVWVNGVRNISKETRRRFNKDYTYTVARPRQYIYKVIRTKNEIWSTKPSNEEDEWIITPIELTVDMLSSNWPDPNDGKLSNLIDDDPSTYFHSNFSSTNNWNSDSYYGDGLTTYPYLQIEMAEPIDHFKFAYTTRNWNSNQGYAPQGFIILGSMDGEEWNEIDVLGEESLPVGAGVSYESPIIEAERAYNYIRFQLTSSTRKNYLVLAEFSMSSVVANPNYGKDPEEFVPELITPAEYECAFHPYGRDYKVHVDFPAAMSTSEYKLPRIDILFGDSVSWGSNMWIGRYGKTYFEDASIEIDGAGIYPDMAKTHLMIRGRGNSSWSNSSSSKNPYRLKFDEKLKPFGLTKGKSWVLLANKQSGSMTTNALAMKIADMVESDGCNHCIPVEVYINGQYRGSYNFTEKIGFSNNSIDLDDESQAAMLELDSYYDESYRFRDDNYNLPVNVKQPDFDDPENTSLVTFEQIQNSFNNFTYCVKNGKYATLTDSSPLDVNSFVRAMLVTDLTRNTELQHPKSWYIYTEDAVYGHSPWHFGPVWDFDWSYGYEGHGQYFINDAETDIFNYYNGGIAFFKQLLRNSEVVKKEYYRLWTKFINDGCVDELADYCDDLFELVEPSFEHNATKWSDGKSYAKTTENARKWLTKRANYIYNNLETYDLGEDIIDNPDELWTDQPDGELDAEKPDAIIDLAKLNKPTSVYNLNGQKVATLRPSEVNGSNLYPGIYIINGKKVAIK